MARQDHAPITDDQIEEFLANLAEGMSVKDAAGSTAFRRRLYRRREHDAQLAADWAAAYKEGTDALTAEARRRAIDGVDEPRMIGHGDNAELITVKRYSDSLLMFLIKQRDPSFRDNVKVEHTSDPANPVIVEHRGVKLSDVLNVARAAGVEPGD